MACFGRQTKLLVVWVSLDGCWGVLGGYCVIAIWLLLCFEGCLTYRVFWVVVVYWPKLAPIMIDILFSPILSSNRQKFWKVLLCLKGFAMWLLVCSGWLPGCFYVAEGVEVHLPKPKMFTIWSIFSIHIIIFQTIFYGSMCWCVVDRAFWVVAR